jgi:hypothetical protein
MWEPRRLTTLWAFTACYRESFTITLVYMLITHLINPWLQSASELYRPSDRRLPAKLVPTLADRGCRVVSARNPTQSLLSGFQTGITHLEKGKKTDFRTLCDVNVQLIYPNTVYLTIPFLLFNMTYAHIV